MAGATYTTSQGDIWDDICKTLYDDEKQMHSLLEANPEYRNTVFFSAGIVLNVPEIEQTSTQPLPPWKK